MLSVLQLSDSDEVHVSAKRPKRRDPVKRRSGIKDCPLCDTPMPYKRVEGSMRSWSPSEYAWVCPKCPVTMLDGSIDPKEDTWEKRRARNDRKRLGAYLSALSSKCNKDDAS